MMSRSIAARQIVAALGWPLAIYLPLGLVCAWLAVGHGPALWTSLLGAVAGFLLWTFIEYWLHRWVLHLIPRGAVRRYIAGRHLLHHRDPNGHPGIALVWVSGIVAALTYGFLALLSDPLMAAAIMTGIIAGYLSYEYAHLATHLDSPPLTPWGAGLRRHHLVHHHGSARHNFAIVLPLWDRVFRTRLQPR